MPDWVIEFRKKLFLQCARHRELEAEAFHEVWIQKMKEAESYRERAETGI